MNKAALIERIMGKTDLTKRQAEAALGAFIESVTEALKEGDRVQLTGFGSFEVQTRSAHSSRVPRTGEKIEVPEKRVPVFHAGKNLKEQF